MLTVDPIQVLQRAQQLLEHGWIAGHEALTKDGKSVLPWDERADAWCVLGSVRAVTYLLDEQNEPQNTQYIMSVISIANPSLLTHDVPAQYKHAGYGYVEQENDQSANGQQRAIQMVRNAYHFIVKHPPKVASH